MRHKCAQVLYCGGETAASLQLTTRKNLSIKKRREVRGAVALFYREVVNVGVCFSTSHELVEHWMVFVYWVSVPPFGLA